MGERSCTTGVSSVARDIAEELVSSLRDHGGGVPGMIIRDSFRHSGTLLLWVRVLFSFGDTAPLARSAYKSLERAFPVILSILPTVGITGTAILSYMSMSGVSRECLA